MVGARTPTRPNPRTVHNKINWEGCLKFLSIMLEEDVDSFDSESFLFINGFQWTNLSLLWSGRNAVLGSGCGVERTVPDPRTNNVSRLTSNL